MSKEVEQIMEMMTDILDKKNRLRDAALRGYKPEYCILLPSHPQYDILWRYKESLLKFVRCDVMFRVENITEPIIAETILSSQTQKPKETKCH